MNKILFQPWGGLGDNLQYSTLPELYAERGYDFYIAESNVYRNSEIYDFVWGTNPYVKGVLNEKPNVGSCMFEKSIAPHRNIVFNQELAHGFAPKSELCKLYYKPNIIDELKDIVVIDISGVSGSTSIPPRFNENIRELFPGKLVVSPFFKRGISSTVNNKFHVDGHVDIESLKQYADVIHSCHHFVCSFSGQTVLASALGKTDTTCYIPDGWQGHLTSGFKHQFCFPNVMYITF
jgi:hypothetical protein